MRFYARRRAPERAAGAIVCACWCPIATDSSRNWRCEVPTSARTPHACFGCSTTTVTRSCAPPYASRSSARPSALARWRTCSNSGVAHAVSRRPCGSIFPLTPASATCGSPRINWRSTMTSPSQSESTKSADLRTGLEALGLRRIAEELDDFLTRATRSRWSPVQELEELVRLEAHERARKSVERRLRRSHLGRFKPMADFDWEWPKQIDRAAVERVLSLGFVERGENVVLVASQGLGKTMVAKNIAHVAILA